MDLDLKIACLSVSNIFAKTANRLLWPKYQYHSTLNRSKVSSGFHTIEFKHLFCLLIAWESDFYALQGPFYRILGPMPPKKTYN